MSGIEVTLDGMPTQASWVGGFHRSAFSQGSHERTIRLLMKMVENWVGRGVVVRKSKMSGISAGDRQDAEISARVAEERWTDTAGNNRFRWRKQTREGGQCSVLY